MGAAPGATAHGAPQMAGRWDSAAAHGGPQTPPAAGGWDGAATHGGAQTPPAAGGWDGAATHGGAQTPPAAGGWDGAATHGGAQMPPAAGGWDGAESPWATTSARLEMPVLPSTFVQERPEPQKPSAVVAPRREGGRTLIVVLSVILAIALLALVGITAWQSMRGGGPISIDYTEPAPTTAETVPAPAVSAPAAPSATAAPRPAARPRPKTDIYDEVEQEKPRR
ncbi:hypothetical protein [Sorangium sp. So ce1335]|uniref:hypothetical protein n=1 Tax=Sorangium sp. So ce1335 TaxID=3133335 RepID=UPI003F61F17D